ncbi:MAG: DUF29 domain-containing protein [Symploca sp. SIO2E6]|nr:DUF29 domain-containing protein [Symploca sp. SIO2E6]
MPTLEPGLITPHQILDQEYKRARREAARQTRLDIATFPLTCPYLTEQILGDWLPE